MQQSQLMNSSFLKSTLAACKKAFIYVAIFSFFINLLYLIVPIYMLQIFDRVLPSFSYDTLIYLTIIAVAGLLVLALLDIMRNRIMLHVSHWFDRKVGTAALQRCPDEILQGNDFASQSLRDVMHVRAFLASPALMILFDAPWVPIFIIAIFLVHPLLGFVALLGAVILFALAILNEYTTRKLQAKVSEASIASQLYTNATLRNAEIIQAMGMMPAIINTWYERNEELLTVQAQAARRSGIILGLSKFFRLTFQILMLGVGAYLVLINQLTPGGMIAGTILLSRALAPVEQALSGWLQMLNARQSYNRLKIYFANAELRSEAMSLPVPKGLLSVEALSYVVPGRNKPVLENISFRLQPGEILALIGPSAAGKTTLAKHIIGVQAASAGIVRLDGANVFAWDREEFGQYVGYQPQNTELFTGTIKENIARMGAANPEAIVTAAKHAGCHEMILQLQNGYETMITSQGGTLSGGQKQRVALARAFYNDPTLLVLDEPNAHLDEAGQVALLDALEKAKEASTTAVVITHTPALLEIADKILWLQDGRVMLFGPREAALKKLKEIREKTVTKMPQKNIA